MRVNSINLSIAADDVLDVYKSTVGDDKVGVSVGGSLVLYFYGEDFREWFGKLEGQAAALGLLNEPNEFASTLSLWFPDEESEWLHEDYRSYLRKFEDERDLLEVSGETVFTVELTFEQWLWQQPAEYRSAYGVAHWACSPSILTSNP